MSCRPSQAKCFTFCIQLWIFLRSTLKTQSRIRERRKIKISVLKLKNTDHLLGLLQSLWYYFSESSEKIEGPMGYQSSTLFQVPGPKSRLFDFEVDFFSEVPEGLREKLIPHGSFYFFWTFRKKYNQSDRSNPKSWARFWRGLTIWPDFPGDPGKGGPFWGDPRVPRTPQKMFDFF